MAKAFKLQTLTPLVVLVVVALLAYGVFNWKKTEHFLTAGQLLSSAGRGLKTQQAKEANKSKLTKDDYARIGQIGLAASARRSA